MSQLIFSPQGLSATQVGKLCQISRLSAYWVLIQLAGKWFVSQRQSNRVNIYSSISLEQIKDRINNSYAEKLKTIEELAILSKEYENKNNITKVWAYTLTWVEWLKSIYEETLKSDYIFGMISNNKTLDQKFLDYLYESYMGRRNKLVKDIKTIFMPFSYKRYITQCKLHKVDIVGKIGVLFDSKTYIENNILLWWKGNVSIISTHLGVITVTTHTDTIFHATMLNMFGILWERTKKI